MKYDTGMTHLRGDILAAVRLMLTFDTEITKKFSPSGGSPAALREYLKNKYNLSGRGDSETHFFCKSTGMDISFERPLNNEGDQELRLSWSQLAVFIRNNWDEVFKDESVSPTVGETQIAFDYTLVTDAEADKLRECEVAIRQETAGYFTTLGEKFKEAQELLANNKNGAFEKWYTSLGFKRQTVYRLIQRYELLYSPTMGEYNREIIDALPLTLSYAISEPNAPKELVERVLEGDITTNAEYQKLLKENTALAEQNAAKTSKNTELEQKLKELESRPIETAVEYVEKIPEDYITRDAYEEMVKNYTAQLDKADEDNLAEKRRAYSEKTELEKRLAEVEKQLEEARTAEAENSSDTAEVFKAYLSNAYSSLNMLVQYVQEHTEYIPRVSALVDNIKKSMEATS